MTTSLPDFREIGFPPSGGWTICPSWQKDDKPFDPAKAEFGDICHALMSAWITWRTSLAREKPAKWTWPTSIRVKEENKSVLSDHVIACTELLDYLDTHPAVEQYGRVPGHMVWTEEYVDFGTAIGKPGEGFNGFIDVILMTPWTLEILDFKFGRYPVDPDSWQLKLYALGAGNIVYGPEFKDQSAQLRQVKLTIGQPTRRPKPYSSVEFGIGQMVQWSRQIKAQIARRIDAVSGKVSDFVVDDNACKFCGAKANCAARLRSTAQTFGATEIQAAPAQRDPAPIAPVEQISHLSEKYARQQARDLDNATISRLLHVAGQLTGFLKDVKEEAGRRLMGGQVIDGWKMIAGRSSRKWTKSEDEIEQVFAKQFKMRKFDKLDEHGNLEEEGYVSISLKSPAQLEKIVRATMGKRRQESFKGLWEMKSGKPTLAPVEDPAPAVNASSDWCTDAQNAMAPVPGEEQGEVANVNPHNATTEGETYDWMK